jgi:hypothetical protein
MSVLFTAVTTKIMSCGVCSLTEIYQRFGRTCYFRITAQRTEFYDCLQVFQPPFHICSMTAHHILLRFVVLTTLDAQQRHSSASPTRRLTATLATSPLLPKPTRFYFPTLHGDRVQSVAVTASDTVPTFYRVTSCLSTYNSLHRPI